jgi:2-iminobutanoate/2-iminopropanoate deaminase
MAHITPIHTHNAPQALGPYSQAIKVTGAHETLFISGQLPIVPETGELISEPAAATEQCMKNLAAILAAADMNFSNVVETTILLKNIADFAVVNEMYASFLQEPYPARITFQAGALPKDASVEIKMTAVK